MDNNPQIKCSSKIHQDSNAVSFCQECRIYMCEKCNKNHIELYSHNRISIPENQKEIFTGFCKEQNHINSLEFFCKSHNKLCCLACVSKINKKGYGQHKDCEICIIEEIKEEKKMKFRENIREFENLSNTVNEAINRIKNSYEELNNKKEEMKLDIQKIFTKIRSELNNREDELLKKIDIKFDDSFIKEKDIKIYEKLPKQISKSLEEIKSIDKEWDLEKLNYFLNCCSNIEKSIDKIKEENESLQKYSNLKLININYSPKEYELIELLERIKSFGDIYYDFEFKKYSDYQNEKPEYIINEGKENIVTKISEEQKWIRVLSKNVFEPQKEYNLKIKIINTKSRKIMLGIAEPIQEIMNKEFFIKSDKSVYSYLIKRSLMFSLMKKLDNNLITNFGWYFNISNSSLYSDSPHNYRGRGINLDNNPLDINNNINNINNIDINNDNIQLDEFKFNINMKDGTFNLIKDNNIIQLYNRIPIDKHITFSVLLLNVDDSVEITQL